MEKSPAKKDGRKSEARQKAKSNHKNRIQSIPDGNEVYVYMLREFVGCVLGSRFNPVRGQAVGLYGAGWAAPSSEPYPVPFSRWSRSWDTPGPRRHGSPLQAYSDQRERKPPKWKCRQPETVQRSGTRQSDWRPDEVIRGNASTSHKLLSVQMTGTQGFSKGHMQFRQGHNQKPKGHSRFRKGHKQNGQGHKSA